MRILLVAPFFEESTALGGMAKAPAEWARLLNDRSNEIEVFTTTSNGAEQLKVPLGSRIRRGGIDVTYFPPLAVSGNSYFSPRLIFACLKRIQEFDLVWSVGMWTLPSAVSSRIARFHGIPYVISLHGSLMHRSLRRHRLRKALVLRFLESKRLMRSLAVICSSELERRHFEDLKIPCEVINIPHVILPKKSEDSDRLRFRKVHGLDDKFIMLFAGRIEPDKGLALTIEAFAAIADRFPLAYLLIAGPSSETFRRSIFRQVARMQLSGRIRFLGLLCGEEYWNALSSANLFVLNSYSENFGLAPAEALSVGVPVLLSDQVGIADLVSKYDAGRVTALNAREIAKAMSDLLSDRDALERKAGNAARLVEAAFSSDVVVQRLEELLSLARA